MTATLKKHKTTLSKIGVLLTLAVWLIALNRCGRTTASDDEDETGGTGPYIYVASGTAYAGNGASTSTPSNTVAKFNADGTFNRVLVDYSLNTGDSPVAMVDYDSDYLLVLVENPTNIASRRIERVAKDGSGTSTFLIDGTNLGVANRNLVQLGLSSDSGFYIGRGITVGNAAIEKYNATKARITIGANAYVSAPAGACATVTTRFTGLTEGPSGVIFVAHAAVSPNNKVFLISNTGYSVVGDCIASVAMPSVNHYPTAMVYLSDAAQMLISFGNTTGPVHSVYSYDATATNLANATQAYSNLSVLQGISAMTKDEDGNIFIAAGAAGFNTVEKFTYASNTLTRVGSIPLVYGSVYTRSPSAIVVAD
jgi:hypothetical protein